jgi:hypothetical protein
LPRKRQFKIAGRIEASLKIKKGDRQAIAVEPRDQFRIVELVSSELWNLRE